MIFIELVFFSFVLSSKGTKLEPTCPNKTRNQRVLWNCYDDGTCYEKSFYYNAREDKCEQFEYKGCGGNGNNFPSLEDCTSRCKRNMTSYDHTFTGKSAEWALSLKAITIFPHCVTASSCATQLKLSLGGVRGQ
nr:kunitz-type serine protease inhibitor LmKTT-1a-like isoform X2 [Rhipicephalus microplus]